MNMALILSAVHQGATVANYTSVIALTKDANGKLNGATLRDELTGDEWNIKAKVRRRIASIRRAPLLYPC